MFLKNTGIIIRILRFFDRFCFFDLFDRGKNRSQNDHCQWRKFDFERMGPEMFWHFDYGDRLAIDDTTAPIFAVIGIKYFSITITGRAA